ncbi:MAG: 3-phosphoserine/phosphohydroxythreonine transaminase [Bacillota bacterium]|jgi:phosphoserine aminotransferase|nr:3-phosphoserine/phosphohydroxythreonine transaminase [Bacillota bacterium]HHU43541.1 3-phosphoserine/phosphohydroxythreonine transaminase [Clostridiales bacterium]
MKVYNFSAGPSTLPKEVLIEAQKDLLDYNGSGMSVLEMSHRGKVFDEIHNEALSLFSELLGISDDYYILFLQGGASQQFDAVPLNLLKKGRADYIVTGNFASKAYRQAQKYGDIHIAASSKDKNYTYIPDVDNITFREDIDYVHITTNNTIFGTKYNRLPKTKAPLVADMSSNIMSEVMDINKFGLIYAGAQKNIAPAGLTVVAIKKELVGDPMDICPTMLNYKTFADANSMPNTPCCFAIYIAMLNFRYLKKLGGVKEIQKINEYKAKLLYDFIDNSDFYTNSVNPADRSIMNVPFVTPDKDTDIKFIKEAAENGLVSLKGHRLVGGMRASIYNFMPVEGVKALIDFMKKFEMQNK